MGRTELYIWGAVLLDSLAGLAGGLLSERWLRRQLPLLVGFAAGAMLAAVFLDIFPELAAEQGAAAFPWAFGGFLALCFLEWGLGHRHHHHHDTHHTHVHDEGAAHLHTPRTLPAALLVSDALHNFGDGAAVAAAFLVAPPAGVSVALAVIAHEVPQEMGDYALLRAAGFSRGPALLALFGVQLTAFLGAAFVVFGARFFHGLQGTLLAVASGMFLYIGATDLLPELHASGRAGTGRQVLGFVLGIALVGGIGLVERVLGFEH